MFFSGAAIRLDECDVERMMNEKRHWGGSLKKERTGRELRKNKKAAVM